LPEEDRFSRLRTERKHFVDTIKMIAYRAESSMAWHRCFANISLDRTTHALCTDKSSIPKPI
jgi:hypothetical protein